jgi:sugar fermentation stimulation protein A
MRFDTPLIPATLIRRYKRFLADVQLDDGQALTVHTPNTGSMLGCAEPGMRVWLRDSGNDKRKYRFSWDISQQADGTLTGVNTALSNRLVQEAIETGVVSELQGYATIQKEQRYGSQNSRIDLFLSGHDSAPDCYVEIKNVTAVTEPGVAKFPDAVTTRGRRHLEELAWAVQQGFRGVLVYCVQRDDIQHVRSADEIDLDYGRTLREVVKQGVEVLAYGAAVSAEHIVLDRPLGHD